MISTPVSYTHLGRPKPPEGLIENYLRRDEKRKQVTLHRTRVPGAKTARTRYRTLTSHGRLSLVECELLTGRTHQIRAHMASIGCPLLGDGKYGTNELNRPYGETGQALYALSLIHISNFSEIQKTDGTHRRFSLSLFLFSFSEHEEVWVH